DLEGDMRIDYASGGSLQTLATGSDFLLGIRRGIDPVGETSNVPDTPLGSRRLVVSTPASTSWTHPCSSHKRIDRGCRHRTTGLWLRTTLRKQLLGHPIAMPGVWGRFTLHRVLPPEEFMGR